MPEPVHPSPPVIDRQSQSAGAIPGSREPDPSFTGSGPAGFDPERKTFAFIKHNLPDAPGKIGVAIVQKCGGQYDAELIDFRLCGGQEEVVAYLALYGISPKPIWTAASGTLPRENTEECSRAKPSGPTLEEGDAKPGEPQ